MSKVRPVMVPYLTARTNLVWLHQVEGHKTEQHHDRGREGVDEELLRSVPSVLPTPVQDQEEHWNQRQFPEHIEHEQVKGDEHPDQCAAHQAEGLGSTLHRFSRARLR